MSLGVTIKTDKNAEQFLDALEITLAGNREQMMIQGAEVVRGEIARAVARLNIRGGRTTGNLVQSFVSSFVKKTSDFFKVGAFSDLVYAAVQNRLEGTTIRAKNREYLFIPVHGKGKLSFRLKKEVFVRGTGYLEVADKAAVPELAILFGKGVRLITKAAASKAKAK